MTNYLNGTPYSKDNYTDNLINDYLYMKKQLSKIQEWIDIRDRLPEKDTGKRILAFGIPQCESHEHIPCIEFCLYLGLYDKQIECELNGDCMLDSNHHYKPKPFFVFGEYDCIFYATHWMPLPQPPIEL